MADMCMSCKGTGKVLAKGTTQKPKRPASRPKKAEASTDKLKRS